MKILQLKLLINQTLNNYLLSNGFLNFRKLADSYEIETQLEELLRFSNLKGDVEKLVETKFENESQEKKDTIYYFNTDYQIQQKETLIEGNLQAKIFYKDYSRNQIDKYIQYLSNGEIHRHFEFRYDDLGNIKESIEKMQNDIEVRKKMGYIMTKSQKYLKEEFYSFHDRKKVFLNGKLHCVEGKGYKKEWIYNSANLISKIKSIHKLGGKTTEVIEEYLLSGKISKINRIEYDKKIKSVVNLSSEYFYDSGGLIRLINKFKNDKLVEKYEFKYHNGELLSIDSTLEKKCKTVASFIYEKGILIKFIKDDYWEKYDYNYDSSGNWILKKEESSNEKVHIYKRQLEYRKKL